MGTTGNAPPLSALLDDMLFSLRRIARNRGSSAAMVGLVALGIGVGACMFTVAHGLLWKPLPFAGQERLVQLKVRSQKMGMDLGWSAPYLDAVIRGNQGFEAIAGYRQKQIAVFDAQGEYVGVSDIVAAQPGLFGLLGTRARAGRLLVEDDALEGAEPVVVVAASLARARFGGDAAVGQSLRIEGRMHRIVGIATDGFSFPVDEVQAWVPMGFTPADVAVDRVGSFGSLRAIGRLRDGTSHDAAAAEMMRLARPGGVLTDIADQIELQLTAQPLRDLWIGERRASIGSMLLAASLVFAVAVANACNLFLLRVLRRRQESALLEAMGATAMRRFLQTCWEAVLLCAAGAAIGGLLVPAGLALLGSYDVLPQGSPLDVSPGLATLLAVLAASALAATVLAGSALLLRGRNVYDVLRQTGNGQTPGLRAHRVRQGLLVAQIAVTFVLLFGTALLVRSSNQLLSQDLGFERSGRLVGRIQPGAWANERDPELIRGRLSAWLDAVRTIPGVQSVALTTSLPFSDMVSTESFGLSSAPTDGGALAQAYVSYVSDGYFDALGQELLRGRGFSAAEAAAGAPVAIIDEAVVAEHFAGRDPLGRTLFVSDSGADGKVEVTVIGVARSARQRSLEGEDEYPSIYRPEALPYNVHGIPADSVDVVVRAVEPEAVAGMLRNRLAAVSSELELQSLLGMEQKITETIIDEVRLNGLLKILGAITVLLTAAGLYALLSYTVEMRHREFGIRQALGASGGDLMRSVFLQGARLLLAALAVGAPLALLFGASLRDRLHGIGPYDPVSISLVAGLLLLAAVPSNLVPALRAARIRPSDALRVD